MRGIGRTVLAAFAVVVGLAAPALAQSGGGKTILVLDASGSMWGQIEGKAKITIAQEVVERILADMPADRILGLTAYGHRRKGDCGDIETLVAPAEGTAGDILAAVNAIKPKGKTPLSASVLAAAEALKYDEDPATVVLVSDGRETCDLDPCEVGRRLEETGVGFTAHVVGFDVAEEADRAQLRCLAENTGGRFLTASSADELAAALSEVSTAPPPEPEPARTDMTFVATEGEGGPRVRRGLLWTLAEVDGDTVIERMEIADLRMALAPGRYRVEVLRPDDEQTVAREVTVEDGASATVELVLRDLTPDATVGAPSGAVAGSTVAVTWTGPEEENDYIAVARPDQPGGEQVNYTYVRHGSPLTLRMPIEPGSYEVRYVRSEGREVLARAAVDVTPVEATLTAPEAAEAGATVQVQWTGPDYENDHIAVAAPDEPGGEYVNYTYTRHGSPLGLAMPPEPGEYEIRYIASQGRKILARQPVTVTDVAASVAAPREVQAGSTVQVEWTGPDYENDHIAVAAPDEPGGEYVNYTYTRHGSPLKLVMPPEPGEYEIRYVQSQGRKILARQPVIVAEVEASIAAPPEAQAGSTVLVEWTGPDYERDHVAVAAPDEPGGEYVNYTYTRHGSPLKVVMPPESGEYEIRYVQSQGRKILARRPLTVTEVEASLAAPADAQAGSTVQVEWTGPDYERDYIAVARPDQQGGDHVKYAYTRNGSPLELAMPTESGEYEIHYVQSQGRKILARHAVTVSDPVATLETSAAAKPGTRLRVDWTGPGGPQDLIAIARPGDAHGQRASATPAAEGSPLMVRLPEQAGDWEVRYLLDGKRVIARHPITLEQP